MTNGLTLLKDQHGEGTPYEPLRIGIGIATGAAFAGSVLNGQDEYAVIGDCVDMADRLCGLAERYGPIILVDEATRNASDADLALLEVDTIAGAPDQSAAKIYALYGNPLVRASPKFRALATFHEHLFCAIAIGAGPMPAPCSISAATFPARSRSSTSCTPRGWTGWRATRRQMIGTGSFACRCSDRLLLIVVPSGYRAVRFGESSR